MALEFKIAPSKAFISSEAIINVYGDLYTLHVNSIAKKEPSENVFDVVMALLFCFFTL